MTSWNGEVRIVTTRGGWEDASVLRSQVTPARITAKRIRTPAFTYVRSSGRELGPRNIWSGQTRRAVAYRLSGEAWQEIVR